MKQKISIFLLWTTYTLVIAIDLLILGAVVNMLFNLSATIIAGVIAFVGAIIGGAITYFGVKKTIQHSEMDKFLREYEPKLRRMQVMSNSFQIYKRQLRAIDEFQAMDPEARRTSKIKLIKKFANEYFESVLELESLYDFGTMIQIEKEENTLHLLLNDILKEEHLLQLEKDTYGIINWAEENYNKALVRYNKYKEKIESLAH